MSLGSVACFLSTEGDGYDYETYGTDGGDCEIGSEGCSCTMGGSCNPGFKCDNNQNICFLDVCPVGTEGCACTPAGACDPIPEGLTCASDICVNLGPSCPAGTEGCACTGGGGCDMGLTCLSDFCVDASNIETGTAGDPPSDDTGHESTGTPADSTGGGPGDESSTGEVLDGTTTNGAGGSSSGTTGG
jgi:hypothetical protein